MAFNPDQYLAEKQALSPVEASGFDPDAYLKEKLGSAPSAYSQLESALMGGVNQLNWAPVVGAAAQHPIEAFKKAMNPLARLANAKEASPEDTKHFDELREALNKNFKEAEHDNPWSYGAGNVAGSLLTAPLMPELAGAKGAAMLGAGMGALSGTGQALSEGKDIGDVAKSAGIQGGIGGMVGGAVGLLANKLSPESLKDTASERAVETFNPAKGEVTKMRTAPVIGENLPEGTTRLHQIGDQLLKPTEFLNNEPILTASGNAEKLVQRLLTAQKNSGEFLGTVAGQVDETGQKLVQTGPISDYIESLQSAYLGPNGKVKPPFASEHGALEQVKEMIAQYGRKNPMSFAEAEAIKQDISSLAYKDNGMISNMDMAKLRGFVNDNIEQALDTATKNMGDKGLYQKYLQAKNLYGATKQIEKSAQGNASKEISNRDFGLTDFLTAGLGYGAHGGPGLMAAVAGKKFLDVKGNQLAAKGANWTANTMKAVGDKFSAYTPEALTQLGKTLSSSDNEIAQKVGRIVSGTAEKDAIGRNAVIFSLMQVPEYRNVLRGITGN